ncbi:transporter substrate-binding domain-containing protein [Pseudomonas sp. KB-10]|uniref:transporter substrate-binding domain-containing protein n=1 Tax=Pseudomonas sp. KB-10 TaxID=2292264 RepID=UPI001BAF237B|nr:transporter substrate-binding domain-containing protein [Pseudomonas sp. KB-10]
MKKLSAAAPLLLVSELVLAQSAGTLDKIKATGAVTLGTREASTPFNFVDDSGRQAGLGWEISLRIARRAQKELALAELQINTVGLTPQTRIALVANQTVDIECSSTTNNRERQKQVSFSNTYFVTETRLLTRKDSGVLDFADLKGKTVAVEAGTTSERLLRILNRERDLDISILLTKDTISNFNMVETGRAVASMGDDIIFFGNIAIARTPEQWAVVGTPQSREAYGCMLRKDDPAFKKLADSVISEMQTSGEMLELYNKYFNTRIDVNGGLEIQVPLSRENAQLYQNPNDHAFE